MNEFEYIDKSNYLRGLLILIGKDNVISDNERSQILKIGSKLGFEKKFCEDAVDDLLSNSYVDHNPPKFVNKSAAENFIMDAIKLGFSDNEIHIEVLEWIDNIAKNNKIDEDWLDDQIQKYGNEIQKVKQTKKIVDHNLIRN